MQTTANSIKRHLLALAAVVAPTVAGVGCAVVLWRVAAGTLALGLHGAPVSAAQGLVGALAGTGVLLIAWVVLGVALEALALVPGALGRSARRLSAALSPAVVRRSVALVVGVGLGAGVGTGGAQAAPARAVGSVVHQVAGAVAGVPQGAPAPLPDPGWSPPTPDPGWTPGPPTVRPQPDLAVLGSRSRAADPDEVVVRRGDSLWSLAARHLGEGASDAEVAAEWPRWYAANRTVVGDDPDLLHPGQVLHPPAEVAS